ncbi:hypothetical protein CRV08_12695 [Halarcobacter ebronensis]|uniref:DUF4139 domain-containing protein n=1 Tax=Halarcobacter ebronensis TaxID=1462615 RepID=A0A4Q0YC53_9BACT|nr:DUF4139 domain-containing protein [Halarcobacter ebronensis]RXJ66471.1 hypothetical protein CRV08_12695 [Halarcobacter ebronensis]
MKLLLILVFAVVSLFANSGVKSIDIFKNRDFINQKLDLSKKSVKLLSLVNLEDIKFIMDDSCEIKSFDLVTKSFENDTLSIQIKKLEDEINYKSNRVKALNSNIAFLQKSSSGTITDVKILEKTSSYITKEILDNFNEIYTIEKEIESDKKSLDEMVKKRENESYSNLNYDISCKKEVLVSYPIFNLEKKSIFDINFNSKNKKVELKNQLFVKHSLGEDLEGIELNFYTFNYIDQIRPYKFTPEYLDIVEKKELKAFNEMAINLAVPVQKSRVLSAVSTADYLEGTTKSFFKAKNVDLFAGKENRVLLSNDIYNAANSIEIDGYSMAQPFYKVDFKSKKLYGAIFANLYLDGLYIGKNSLNDIKKDEESSIYFGNSRLIDVKKELIKDLKEEPFFSVNRVKTEKIWDYIITNNSKKREKIALLERVPVSKHEDIKVKLIGKTKESKLEKDGKITFEFELDPNETKKINFGYEIDKPTIK